MILKGGEHAAICGECGKQACGSCFLVKNNDNDDDDGDLCNSCGFQCTSCRAIVHNSVQENNGFRQPFCCQGQSAVKNSTPCPFGKGQGLICWECEDNGEGGRRCSTWQCRRMACDQCNVIRDCDICGELSCIFCDSLNLCATCNYLVCDSCNGNGGREISTCDVVRLLHTVRRQHFLPLARSFFLA